MKYTLTIDIDQPRKKVIELFDKPDNLKHWQPGLISFEHLSGEPGTVGAKSRILYKMGKRETEMTETIIEYNLPEKMLSTYEANGVLNIQENYFEEINENQTRWISVCEFQFNNFAMKLMGWIMPGAFKKQSYKFMKHFKEFAEKQN